MRVKYTLNLLRIVFVRLVVNLLCGCKLGCLMNWSDGESIGLSSNSAKFTLSKLGVMPFLLHLLLARQMQERLGVFSILSFNFFTFLIFVLNVNLLRDHL